MLGLGYNPATNTRGGGYLISTTKSLLFTMVGVSMTLQLPLVCHAQATPPANASKARPAWRYDVAGRCPGMRVAEEGTGAAAVFLVGPTGVPSQASIRVSSHSDSLDSATLSCIPNLRFQPDTRLGSGETVPSWQTIALDWAPVRGGAAASAGGGATPGGPAAPAATGSGVGAVASGATVGSGAGKTVPVTVRVCDDDTGKLAQPPSVVRSSGVAAFDDAALKIAAAGASYYRPSATVDSKAASGCARLVIEFETK